MQSVRAKNSIELSKLGIDGAHFSNEQIAALAKYKKHCDVVKLNLESTKKTLKKCKDRGAPVKQWWSDPYLVIGGMAVSLSVGVIVGVLIKK
jgi:hypothetical protein